MTDHTHAAKDGGHLGLRYSAMGMRHGTATRGSCSAVSCKETWPRILLQGRWVMQAMITQIPYKMLIADIVMLTETRKYPGMHPWCCPRTQWSTSWQWQAVAAAPMHRAKRKGYSLPDIPKHVGTKITWAVVGSWVGEDWLQGDAQGHQGDDGFCKVTVVVATQLCIKNGWTVHWESVCE